MVQLDIPLRCIYKPSLAVNGSYITVGGKAFGQRRLIEKMTDNKEQTYDFICFTDLAYEFDFSEKKEIEKKIKRRLKYYNLGDYKQDRVEYIRQLKNDLYSEISKTTKSKYCKHPAKYVSTGFPFQVANHRCR